MANALHGSAFALARWFQLERYANRPEDDVVREEVLADLYLAERVGVHGDAMLVRTPNGACMVHPGEHQGSPLVVFDYVEHRRWTRTRFWMNASSVEALVQHLRTGVPRAPFDALFVGAEVA